MIKRKISIIAALAVTASIFMCQAVFAVEYIPISNTLEADIEVEKNPEIEVATVSELTDALNGDYTTIILRDGEYTLTSNLEIARAVIVKALNRHGAVVNGNITVKSGDVVIDGLKVNAKPDASEGSGAILVDTEGSGIEIKNCDISSERNGITVLKNCTLTIDSNIIMNKESSEFSTHGIKIGSMENTGALVNVTLKGNMVSGNRYTGSDNVDSSGIFIKTRGTVTVGDGTPQEVTRENAEQLGSALEAQTDSSNGLKVLVVDPDSTNGDLKISSIWYPIPVTLAWTAPEGPFKTRKPFDIAFAVSSCVRSINGKNVVYVIKFTKADGAINEGDILVNGAVKLDGTPGEFHMDPFALADGNISCTVEFTKEGPYRLKIFAIEVVENP